MPRFCGAQAGLPSPARLLAASFVAAIAAAQSWAGEPVAAPAQPAAFVAEVSPFIGTPVEAPVQVVPPASRSVQTWQTRTELAARAARAAASSASSAAPPSRTGFPRPEVSAVEFAAAGLPYAAGADASAALRQQLADARAAEAALTVENDMLRQQLERWEEAGLQVAEREARVVEMLHSGRKANSTPAAGTAVEESGLSLLSSGVQTYVFNAGKAKLDSKTNALRIGAIFVCANAVAFLMFAATERGTKNPAELVSTPPLKRWMSAKGQPGGIYNTMCQGVTPALRKMGFGNQVLEIADLRVSGLAPYLRPGDEALVVVQSGADQELRTGSVRPSESGLLRYDGTQLHLPVAGENRGQGTCTIAVVRGGDPFRGGRDARLAAVRVPVQDLVRFAAERGGEYFSFDLVAEVATVTPVPRVGGHAPPGPRLAFRLRDATDAEAPTPPAAPASPRRVARRGLESFAPPARCRSGLPSATSVSSARPSERRLDPHSTLQADDLP